MSVTDLDEGMDRISIADLSPRDALQVFRKLLETAPETFAMRAYVALSSATLRILTARQTTELREWTDLIRQVSAQIKRLDSPAVGQQLLALSDLMTAWTRLSEANAPAAILERPHCRAILTELRRLGGTAQRKDIIAAVGLGEANFSRILGSLEAVGLIRRNNLRVRMVTLTTEGERLLQQVQSESLPSQRIPLPAPPPRPQIPPGRPEVVGRHLLSAEGQYRRSGSSPMISAGNPRKDKRLAARGVPDFKAIRENLLGHASLQTLGACTTAVDDTPTASVLQQGLVDA